MNLGFPSGSEGEEYACNAGVPRSGRSGESLPTTAFLPGEFHGHRSLEGYSPWGRKESDMTEQLTLSLSVLST